MYKSHLRSEEKSPDKLKMRQGTSCKISFLFFFGCATFLCRGAVFVQLCSGRLWCLFCPGMNNLHPQDAATGVETTTPERVVVFEKQEIMGSEVHMWELCSEGVFGGQGKEKTMNRGENANQWVCKPSRSHSTFIQLLRTNGRDSIKVRRTFQFTWKNFAANIHTISKQAE